MKISRRDFLKGVAGAGALAALPKQTEPESIELEIKEDGYRSAGYSQGYLHVEIDGVTHYVALYEKADG